MFSMTKSRELDEVQTPFNFVKRRHYGEDVKFYQNNILFSKRIVFFII